MTLQIENMTLRIPCYNQNDCIELLQLGSSYQQLTCDATFILAEAVLQNAMHVHTDGLMLNRNDGEETVP